MKMVFCKMTSSYKVVMVYWLRKGMILYLMKFKANIWRINMKSTGIYALLLTMVFSTGCANNCNRPIVGAIRWDGMFADSSWAKNLEPTEYHGRLPFYTTWQNGKPVVNADKQEVMDKEIDYAKNSGLDYWSFVYYSPASWPEADKYNYGWKRYLASDYKNDINFCLNLQGPHLGPKEDWPETAQKFVDFFIEPTYQKVLGNRPLIYVFYIQKLIETFGSSDEARKALNYLRKKTVDAGLGEPYMVVQVFDPSEGARYIDELGFDAIGAYSAQYDPDYQEQREYPYSVLAKINAKHWQACENMDKEVVPLVNAGWDIRPRWWDAELMVHYSGQHRPYFTQPTPLELAEHTRSAMNWVVANQQAANAILIYAWNENDEGSWLVPTVAEDAARLDAIREAISNWCK
jgi:glycosyl transferase family WbsX